jgi:hypothetical protein
MAVREGSPNRRWPGDPGGHHSTVRAGGCATPTGFAARAGAPANHVLTFKLDHSLGADQLAEEYVRPLQVQ